MPRFRVRDLMINVGEGWRRLRAHHQLRRCNGALCREHAGLRVHRELQLHDPHVLP